MIVSWTVVMRERTASKVDRIIEILTSPRLGIYSVRVGVRVRVRGVTPAKTGSPIGFATRRS